jgi:hypothetical protein
MIQKLASVNQSIKSLPGKQAVMSVLGFASHETTIGTFVKTATGNDIST